MADGQDTLAEIIEEVASIFEPVANALESPQAFAIYIREMGWDISAIPAALQNLGPPIRALIARIDAGEIDAGAIPEVVNLVRAVVEAIDRISSSPAAGLPPGFLAEFPRQLLDRLIVDYLGGSQPAVAGLLQAFGVIEWESRPAAPPRLAYRARIVRFEAMAELMRDPLATLKGAYDWGAAFKAAKFIENLRYLLIRFGLHVRTGGFGQAAAQALLGSAPPEGLRGIDIQLMGDRDRSLGATEIDIGLRAAAVPGGGVLIAPYAQAELGVELPLGEDLSLLLEGAGSFDSAFGVLLRPGIGIAFPTPPSGPAAEIIGSVALKAGAADGSRTLLFGVDGGSRFEREAISLKAGGQFSSSRAPIAFVEAAVKGGRIVIALGGADGFLAKILPADGLAIDVDLTIGLNSATGLYFAGSGGLEIALPAHVELGPVEIQSALLAVRLRDSVIALEMGASFKVDLSVLKATVENMGLRADLSFRSDGRGVAGPVDLAFNFKPPNGVGLAIAAGPVVGGGYLFFDFDREEYGGALELALGDIVTITALGLITTRMPDGSKGFSLLAILAVEFGAGLQLGLGFKLIGLGGLVGLNRTMLFEPLAQGLRSGVLNSILFPRDVVANATRIIADLRAVFPPAPDRFLVGPMAKLGWGTPTLVSVTLGVIIEIPGNIAIIGKLRVALPTDDAAILVLQVAFIGAIEFDKKRLWFYATLYESRLLMAPLDGDFGLLVDYSDNPSFLISIGGFHPRFDPPPLPFPTLNRISFALLNQAFARIRVQTYQAVTSNTVQFGARAELFFGLDALSVEGHLGLDALIRFSPFYFIVEVSAAVSIKVFGAGLFSIRLEFSLEGPTPYRAHGHGSIDILFFSISADFDVTWGDAQDTTLPPIEALPLLRAEIEKDGNWRALPAPGASVVVTLRALAPEETAIVLHPLGGLRVSQQGAPLDLPLDKIGTQKPSDANRFSLSATAGGLVKRRDASEKFAIAQFKDLDDAAKLSAPAFEPLHGGCEFDAAVAMASGAAVQRTVRYELVTIDVTFARVFERFITGINSLFAHFMRGSAVSRNPMSLAQEQLRQPFAEKVKLSDDLYALAGIRDARALADQPLYSSRAEASAALVAMRTDNPSAAAQVQIVAAAELVE